MLQRTQRALACLVAACLAASPLIPSTWPSWVHAALLIAAAVGYAVNHELGSQSQLAGDKGAPADQLARLKVADRVAPLACLVLLSGCLSSAPIVPVTAANQAQVASCQSSAAVHNDVVIGGFVLGGIGAGLGSAGAVVTDSGQQKALAIGAAIAGGLTLIDSAIVGFSAQNFANGNCTAVVGALPVTPLGDTTVTVTAPGGGK